MLVTQILHRSWIVVAAIVIATCPSRGADAPSCGELPCRANGMPYVTTSGTIIILPGEKFWVELKIEGDKIVALIPRKEPGSPNTLQLRVFVERGATALIWGNQLDRPVLFDATATAPQRETSRIDCPLPPKKYTYQLWTFVAEAIEIGNFGFVPAAGAKCD